MKKVVAHILKLKIQLLKKIKQKKAILTSNMESIGIPLIDVKLLQEASHSKKRKCETNTFQQ